MKLTALAFAVAAAIGSQTDANAITCCAPAAADYPAVGGNLGNQGYSSLTQINKGNIKSLGAAWLNHLEGGSTAQTQVSTAVAIDGVLYIETTQGKVYAVDGASGAVKWTYNPGFGTGARRGVAVGQGLVFTEMPGRRVIALNKDTGAVVWTTVLPAEEANALKVAVTYWDGMVYVGTDDQAQGTAFALRASDGTIAWKFHGAPSPGEFGYDTWGGATPTGATPWSHPAIDPNLGIVYWTFGNARAGGAVDGRSRPGTNLFANTLVALDAKTGQRKWHFQSVHHDIWDMDNVMPPLFVDVKVNGVVKAGVVYGSKSGMNFILDRATGAPLIGVDEKPVPQDATQNTWPTQPFAQGDPNVPLCPTPTGDSRPVPNYLYGCLYTPHTDKDVIQSPGTGGGNDWAGLSYSPHTNLFYTGYGLINSAHSIPVGGVGQRPLGENKGGGMIAKDPNTNKIVWKKDLGWSVTHGVHVLTTASDLLFVGQPDGNLLSLDATNGRELWRFQTGAGVHTGAITYLAGGQQYVAVFSGGNGLPYADSPRGDFLWAFKIGGTVAQATAPTPPARRQPISAASVDGPTVNNTINLARTYANGAVGTTESTSGSAMAPQNLSVKAGTTVTFLNPATNTNPHCATQFFEGLFNFKLNPGQSATYTFNTPGEYFYNDCTTPATTGKVIVY